MVVYSEQMGIFINVSKTKLLVFSETGKNVVLRINGKKWSKLPFKISLSHNKSMLKSKIGNYIKVRRSKNNVYKHGHFYKPIR